MRKLSVIILIISILIAALPAVAQEGAAPATSGSPVIFAELYTRADAATEAGDYDKAIVDYTLFLLLNPTFSQGYFSRGLNYDLLGESNLAIQDYSRALDYTSPSSEYTAALYFSRANLYLNQNDLTAALTDLNASVDAYPEGTDSRLQRARVLTFQQRYEDALDDYDALVDLQPESPDNYIERAMLYNVMQDFDGALTDLNSAIDLNPQNSDFYLMRGSVNTVTDHRTDAASDYLQWILLNRTREFTSSSAVTDNQAFVVEMRPGYMYSIPLQAAAGQVISITTDSLSQTPVDPLLVILDTNGEPLIADDDSGGNMNAAITNYELPQEGEYTLIIGHAAGMQDTPGDIRISVELAILDVAEDTSGD